MADESASTRYGWRFFLASWHYFRWYPSYDKGESPCELYAEHKRVEAVLPDGRGSVCQICARQARDWREGEAE